MASLWMHEQQVGNQFNRQIPITFQGINPFNAMNQQVLKTSADQARAGLRVQKTFREQASKGLSVCTYDPEKESVITVVLCDLNRSEILTNATCHKYFSQVSSS